jgi:hypothetical protein
MTTTVAQVARDHILTAIDLTRACAESDLYLEWLSLHSDALGGSAGIASYLTIATIAFEEQAPSSNSCCFRSLHCSRVFLRHPHSFLTLVQR